MEAKAMKRNKGFTLIELLIVIAVIGVVAAVLFPMFAQPREGSRRSCLSNMKQIGTGLLMYVQDYDETFPNYRFLPLGSQSSSLSGADGCPSPTREAAESPLPGSHETSLISPAVFPPHGEESRREHHYHPAEIAQTRSMSDREPAQMVMQSPVESSEQVLEP